MCGIFGYTGNIPQPVCETLARTLCLLNQERGNHSAGIAITTRRTLDPVIVKKAVTPREFIKTRGFRKTINVQHRTLIGHTRFATHGSVTTQNAHPFQIGKTVGVHNGVVSNTRKLAEYTGQQFSVDSMYLVYMLDRHGNLGPAMGSTNVAYFGAKDHADLRIIRNMNPLAWSTIMHSRRHIGFVFSSDEKHLADALLVAGVKHSPVASVPDGKMLAISYCEPKGEVQMEFHDAPLLTGESVSKYRVSDFVERSYTYGQQDYYYHNKARTGSSCGTAFQSPLTGRYLYRYENGAMVAVKDSKADSADPLGVLPSHYKTDGGGSGLDNTGITPGKSVLSMTDDEFSRYEKGESVAPKEYRDAFDEYASQD